MLDRQRLEAILTNRFPGTAASQLAATVNAIMALTEHRSVELPRRRGALAHDESRRPAAALTMTTVTVSSQIAAPIKRVFELFTDIEHAAQHVSGIKDVKLLTPAPFQLGTRWRETREVLGRLDSAEMEVTAFERYRTYTIAHHKAGVHIETVFSFVLGGLGTQVDVEFTLDPAGFPPSLLGPLGWAIAGTVRHVLNHDLADLKTRLEAAD